MNKNLMMGAALLIGLFYLLGRQAKAQTATANANANYWQPVTGAYNPNKPLNGGYAGPLGNMADGNPYSIGL